METGLSPALSLAGLPEKLRSRVPLRTGSHATVACQFVSKTPV